MKIIRKKDVIIYEDKKYLLTELKPKVGDFAWSGWVKIVPFYVFKIQTNTELNAWEGNCYKAILIG
jgi:hypothetical protein